ncbi:penicillin acylase family protein [Telmatobacter bradus]|uniref:penicillin acylase family protein n=1 Tax=Telmatobacter bradus TaxID=474953 RepID=UPI003B433479
MKLKQAWIRSTSESPKSVRIARWAKRLGWFVAGLVAVAAVGYGTLALWLHAAASAALPQLDGEAMLAGLSTPVRVLRDGHGVPHIEAATQTDLFTAQGYVTAQDRLWQMDLMRRAAGGNLAEILGKSMLEHDKASRVLLFRPTAQRIYANLPADERQRVDAYARGVNFFIAQHANTLPAEFRLLGYRPEPWTGVDSISIGLLVVQMLDTHWPTKLAHEHVTNRLQDKSLLDDLYPVGSWRDRPPTGLPHDANRPLQPTLHPAGHDKNDEIDEDDEPAQAKLTFPAELLPGLKAVLNLPACSGCIPGSNNWVVSGQHTASGHPLLANDMHLGLTVPNIWYMADLQAPGYHAAGVSLPGMPYIIEGHNEHVAWGITALMGDAQDLYIEKLDGKGNFQRNDASWQPLRVSHEVIKVRGSHAVLLDVQSTDHGPLLNPILPKEKRPLALKWTIYDAHLNSMPVYRVNTAANWQQFTAALADWCWPTLNIVYADDAGHIGYHAVGRIPIHSAANDLPLPLAAKNRREEWGGFDAGSRQALLYVPFDSMPSSFDPPSGFLATANARVTTDSSKYPIAREWVEPYRVERIYKSLEGRDGLTPADMLAVQTDVYSEFDQEMGQRIAYAIDHSTNDDPRLHQAAKLLRAWDGRLSTDSAAASIITQTRMALWPMLLEPKLGKDWSSYEWGESNFAMEEIVMHAKAAWLPKKYKNWDELLTAAVRLGLQDGHAPSDLRRWRYGNWHVVDLEHPLAKMLPLIGPTAGTGALPLSGDTTTVKQVGRAFGPSQRFTMDWSNVDGSTENIVLGQSGNPLSPHFRDQWNTYYSGTTFALPFTDAAVARQTRHTLVLKP